jgi:hypothetical protein
MVTVFKDFNDTTNPKFYHIDKVLDRIKQGSVKELVEKIRLCTDKKQANSLKKKLPCILFSGKFSQRLDSALTEHSGFVILDWDNLTDPEQKKLDLKRFRFIYSVFISPSGNGVKAVAKIPAIKEKHRGYYNGLLSIFPELDSSNINEGRICYASYDPNIYINTNAEEFTTYIDGAKPKKESTKKIKTDYSKINISLNMIRNSVDGSKHETLLKASKLMGGYIQSGYVDEYEAVRLLEQEIGSMNIDDFAQAQKTIQDGINYGKSEPIIETPKSKVNLSISHNVNSYIASQHDVENYLDAWRTDTFKKGLTTGIDTLDVHFLFKEGNFNVFNGFDNVGKSTTLWYLILLSMIHHKWRWVIYSGENANGTVMKRMIEFYWSEKINLISEQQYNEAKDFINKHLVIINNNQLYNFKDILHICETLDSEKKINGCLIDPYNALKIDLSDNSKLSTHEYHYEAASEMQMFAKKKKICVYLNCHVVTYAMRLKTPPMKADTEGGGKFANKADDFVTIHRETQDTDKWAQTELHVRKIKELETGGGYTPLDRPYILTMNPNSCGFRDCMGVNPVLDWHKKRSTSLNKQVTENTNFLTEGIKTFEGEVPF